MNKSISKHKWAIIAAALSLLALLGINSYYSFQEKRAEFALKMKEESRLRQEITALKAENAELKKREIYLKTGKGIEDEARIRLGLVKNREVPIIITHSPAPTSQTPPAELKNKAPEKGKSLLNSARELLKEKKKE